MAAAAYLNARTQLSHDLNFINLLVRNALGASSLDKKDRVNVFYKLEERAKDPNFANHPCLIYEGRTWTFAEAYDATLKHANWLKTEYGIAAKEIVALDYMNSPTFLWMIYALWSLGAIPALINYNLTSNALIHCIKTSTARLVFVDQEVQHNLTEEVTNALSQKDFRQEGNCAVQVVFHDDATASRVETTMKPFRASDSERSGAGMNKGNRTAVLISTSGTTGLPKAAIGRLVLSSVMPELTHSQ